MTGRGRSPRLLGVFAHPDDETFCAGGTFARYASVGAEAMVVSATRGQAGQIRDARAATRRTIGQVREGELRLACERLGIQQVRCLDYEDGGLDQADREALVGDIVRVTRSFRPDAVFTFGPDGGYRHPDHIAISEATTAALKLSGNLAAYPSQIADGLTPYQPAKLFYSYFPPSNMLLLDHLVRWLVDRPDRFSGSVDFVHTLLLLVEEATMLNYARDSYEIKWFPAGSFLIEQGEPAITLFLILSGQTDVVQEQTDGTMKLLDRLGQGQFFGELGIAHRAPRSAHVIATESVTCLVFSPSEPTKFVGRGRGARLVGGDSDEIPVPQEAVGEATTCIDVGDFIDQKVQALAAYRTQYPLEAGMIPKEIWRQLFGREYFVEVYPPRLLRTDLF